MKMCSGTGLYENVFRDRITWVGATADDEMCNFYVMYWTEADSILKNERYCTAGTRVIQFAVLGAP